MQVPFLRGNAENQTTKWTGMPKCDTGMKNKATLFLENRNQTTATQRYLKRNDQSTKAITVQTYTRLKAFMQAMLAKEGQCSSLFERCERQNLEQNITLEF